MRLCNRDFSGHLRSPSKNHQNVASGRESPKVSSPQAENQAMENELNPADNSNDPDYQRARALSLSVGAIRKAQGKKSPGDFPIGSVEWHATVEDFANDVLKAMLAESDMPILEFKRDNARK